MPHSWVVHVIQTPLPAQEIWFLGSQWYASSGVWGSLVGECGAEMEQLWGAHQGLEDLGPNQALS